MHSLNHYLSNTYALQGKVYGCDDEKKNIQQKCYVN